MRFQVVIAMHNVAPWIEENIGMLAAQTDRDFRCVIVDDVSTDDTVERAKRAIGADKRFTLVVNRERRYLGRNVWDAISMTGAQDDDVIVMVDGDDKLADEHVLATLREVYHDQDCWMTYGSSVDSDGRRVDVSQPYSESVIRRNNYRKRTWLAFHLKTCRYGLWKRIRPDAFAVTRDEYRTALRRALLTGKFRAWKNWRKIRLEDLHDPSGRFIRRVFDKALTFPMLEMAGARAVFVERVMYVYNHDQARTSTSMYGSHDKKWPGRLVRDVIRHKQAYARLDKLN